MQLIGHAGRDVHGGDVSGSLGERHGERPGSRTEVEGAVLGADVAEPEHLVADPLERG